MYARGELLLDPAKDAEVKTQTVDDSLAAWGLAIEQPADDADEMPLFSLWPESLPVFLFWLRLQTQWRISDGRRHGLDYPGVWVVIEKTLCRRLHKRWFAYVQAMEVAALNGFAEVIDEKGK